MENVIWTSEPMRIGRHDWRMGVHNHPIYGPCSFYEWKPVNSDPTWQSYNRWPAYNHNDTFGGLPKSLVKLWDREQEAIHLHLHGEKPAQQVLFA